MKCRVCREPAIIDIRRHNANFCRDHFERYCHQQVERAIAEFDMLQRDDRVLVAVSGGKDSLAVWAMLLELGYQADGLYVGLGIGDYSGTSAEYARSFARDRSLELIEVDLRTTYDYDIPTAAAVTKRVPCSACGLSKRHIFDSVAIEHNYDVLVTGHNLDDEVAVLYGNVMRWQTDYLGRQQPVLAATGGFPRKVKPLVRLTERETAAYCITTGIDYLVEECPMAAGNKHLHYKEALNALEKQSPGTKTEFYFGFLKRAAARFRDDESNSDSNDRDSNDRDSNSDDRPVLGLCSRCGSPATGEVCAFCRLTERVGGAAPVPVELIGRRS